MQTPSKNSPLDEVIQEEDEEETLRREAEKRRLLMEKLKPTEELSVPKIQELTDFQRLISTQRNQFYEDLVKPALVPIPAAEEKVYDLFASSDDEADAP